MVQSMMMRLAIIGALFAWSSAPVTAQSWPDCPTVVPLNDVEAVRIQAALDKKVCAIRVYYEDEDGNAVPYLLWIGQNGPTDYIPFNDDSPDASMNNPSQPDGSPRSETPNTNDNSVSSDAASCAALISDAQAKCAADAMLYGPQAQQALGRDQTYFQYVTTVTWPRLMKASAVWAADVDGERRVREAGCAVSETLTDGGVWDNHPPNNGVGAVGFCLSIQPYNTSNGQVAGFYSQQCPSVLSKYAAEIGECAQHCDFDTRYFKEEALVKKRYTWYAGDRSVSSECAGLLSALSKAKNAEFAAHDALTQAEVALDNEYARAGLPPNSTFSSLGSPKLSAAFDARYTADQRLGNTSRASDAAIAAFQQAGCPPTQLNIS